MLGLKPFSAIREHVKDGVSHVQSIESTGVHTIGEEDLIPNLVEDGDAGELASWVSPSSTKVVAFQLLVAGVLNPKILVESVIFGRIYPEMPSLFLQDGWERITRGFGNTYKGGL